MNISKSDFVKVAIQSGINPEQAELLWANLDTNLSKSGRPRFTAENVIYYIGALIVIGAMGWFMTNAWEKFGGPGIFYISSIYAVVFISVGAYLWQNPSLKIPSGLLFSIAVCMVPLAIYGLERWTEFWPKQDPGYYTRFHPYINGSWLIMEVGTVITGLLVFRKWRFPFLMAPVAYALWFMSMDLADFVIQGYCDERKIITMLFGLAMLLITYIADLRSKSADITFWGYLFGLMAFWGGLTAMHSDSELSKFIYCLINLFLIFLSLALSRRAFIVFGSLGLFGYLYHLADVVFKDSLYFPFALSGIGLIIICLGLFYQKNRKKIQNWFNEKIIPNMGNLIPQRVLNEK